MKTRTKKRYYIDMDGVLVKYDRNAYKGDNPRFLRPNEHYYRDLEPDRKMLAFVDELIHSCRYTGDEVFILTSLPLSGSLFNEQFHDKIVWLSRWVPAIDIDHIIISVTNKRDAAEYINDCKLTANDILIDDYNKNLVEWNNANGTAIKYCNGINNPESFNGKKLLITDSVWNALRGIGIDTSFCS